MNTLSVQIVNRQHIRKRGPQSKTSSLHHSPATDRTDMMITMKLFLVVFSTSFEISRYFTPCLINGQVSFVFSALSSCPNGAGKRTVSGLNSSSNGTEVFPGDV